MAAPRENRQTWANLIRPDQEPTQEGPGNGEKVHPNLDMSSHTPGEEVPKQGWAASLLQPDDKAAAQEQGHGAGEKVHPNLDMSSYGQNTEGSKQTWAERILGSEQPKGDPYLGIQQGATQEEKSPSKWAQMAAAIGAVGGASVGSAIEKGFTGTGEFVSRFFGLPEHAAQSPEQQAAPQQDHNRDHDPGMDR